MFKLKKRGQKCQVSGTKAKVGNNVSHSKRRTKTGQLPNLQVKKFWDKESKSWVKLKVTAKILKTITKKGLRPTLKQYGIKLGRG